MRQKIQWLICVSLVSALVGCGDGKIPAPEKKKDAAASTATAVVPNETQTATQPAVDTSKYVLVSLDVPNMTWGGCAASVRRDLEKIETATEISTDTQARKCSFKVAPDVDYNAKLAEFAKANEHLAGYTPAQ